MKYRVAEIFGPTIQGEGRFVGEPCYFIRLGGCDYRCSWCDSLHAVLPEHVKQLPFLNEREIVEKLMELENSFRWIIISGGNPALYDLSPLMEELDRVRPGTRVAVETQGTVWHESLPDVDYITISPKPPSSGMRLKARQFKMFLEYIDTFKIEHDFKFVVFNLEDYTFAMTTAKEFGLKEVFLSVGTRPEDTSENILERWRWLVAITLNDKYVAPFLTQVRVLPQSHVLLWGHKLGV